MLGKAGLSGTERIVMEAIVEAALAGAPCPSNETLASMMGSSLAVPPCALKRLEAKGLLVVTRFQTGREVFVHAIGKGTKPCGGSRRLHWRDVPKADRPKPFNPKVRVHPRDVPAAPMEILPPAVDREPCPCCATRSDIGCEHQAASGTDPVRLKYRQRREWDRLGLGRAAWLRQWIADKAAENARRVPCAICLLAILPENMERHMSVVHDEDCALVIPAKPFPTQGTSHE